MGKITFILGGARSGKSTFAFKQAGKYKKVAFVATCQPLDTEMKRRIKLHQKNRPPLWQTFEEPRDIVSILKKAGSKFDCIVIDCLTLLVSNLIFAQNSQAMIENKIKKISSYLKETKPRVFIVSNEVGLGIVPDTKLGRDFRDIAGRINQLVAAESQEVYFLVSGIAQKIK